MHKLINTDAQQFAGELSLQDRFACCILDPPDAIKLKSWDNAYIERPMAGYLDWLMDIIECVVARCSVVWLSYNSIWDLAIKHRICEYWYKHKHFEIKPFVWTYTFGQNRNTDCGPGHRPILRIRQFRAPLYPEQIKVPSWRQLNGDKRAAPGGRVPLDVFDFPRIVGNAKERRSWHPTQHPEALIERMIKLTTKEGGRVLDLFAGTGTTLRVCKRINRDSVSVELSPKYCEEIAAEHNMQKKDDKTWILS